MVVQMRSAVEIRACPMCAGTEHELAIDDPPHRVLRCEACGFCWVTPRMDEEDLELIYASGSYWRSEAPKVQGYADYPGSEELYLKTFRRRLDYVLRDGPFGGRALDVGSAAGFCMKALHERGFEVYGVELSAEMAEHTRERFGFETVHVGTFESAPFEPASFELITMWDVVEHVVDARGFLRKAHRLLKPGGTLVLETQNIDSLFARLLGRRWHHFKHAEHIYHFNRNTIASLLRSAGFRPGRITPRFGGKYVSFGFIAERSSRLHPALSSALRPLTRLRGGLYVNVMDEIIVVSATAPADES